MPLVACQRGREGPESLQGQGLTPSVAAPLLTKKLGWATEEAPGSLSVGWGWGWARPATESQQAEPPGPFLSKGSASLEGP